VISQTNEAVQRRDCLTVLGTGAGAAAAVVPMVAAPTAAEARETGAERTKARYRETDHVKTYYKTNRY
jgi:hypothetical protein